MTLPGNHFIYYGEEIGITWNKPDKNIRKPFIWGNSDPYQSKWKALDYNTDTQSIMSQELVSNSLLNHYKDIIRLRQNNEALLLGSFLGLETVNSKVIAYKRIIENKIVT